MVFVLITDSVNASTPRVRSRSLVNFKFEPDSTCVRGSVLRYNGGIVRFYSTACDIIFFDKVVDPSRVVSTAAAVIGDQRARSP